MASMARWAERLLSASRSVGTLATRSPTARTAASSSSAGWARLAKPHCGGLDPGHRVAGQQRLHAVAQPHHPRLPLHVGRRHQAHRRVADRRVLGHVHEVAGRGQLGPAGQAVAVDLGDDRRGHVPHLEPVVDDVARPPTVDLGDRALDVVVAARAEVVAGREARPGAPDDDDRDLGVAVGGPQPVEQRAAQGVVERVALGRSVQRQAADPRRRVIDQQHGFVGVVHGRTVPNRRCHPPTGVRAVRRR